MSGHSKWSTIKRKKGAADAQRGKLFTKIGREIAMAVKEGGADPVANSRLRDAIAKAKNANMPNDNIQRSIKRNAGGEAVTYEENVYEGYAAGGVAVIVNTLTDNKNRTVSDVRHAFDKHGGSLGATGCVNWMFTRQGQLVVDRGEVSQSEDDFMMLALDIGAEDVSVTPEIFEVLTSPADFSAVREGLESKGISFLSADIVLIPQNMQAVSEEDLPKVQAMIERLEDLDDVQEVFHNGDLPMEEDEE